MYGNPAGSITAIHQRYITIIQAAGYVAEQESDSTIAAAVAVQQIALDPNPIPCSLLQPNLLTAAQAASAEAEPEHEPEPSQQACLLMQAVLPLEPLQNEFRLVYPDLNDSAQQQLPALSYECQQQLLPQLLQGPLASLQGQPSADTAIQHQGQQSTLASESVAEEDHAKDAQAALGTLMLSCSAPDLLPSALATESAAFDADHTSRRGSRNCPSLVSEAPLSSRRSHAEAEQADAESTSAVAHLQDELLQTLHMQQQDGCMEVSLAQVCVC